MRILTENIYRILIAVFGYVEIMQKFGGVSVVLASEVGGGVLQVASGGVLQVASGGFLQVAGPEGGGRGVVEVNLSFPTCVLRYW